MSDKVVLAYSGGLDTTVAVQWLKENYGLDVVAMLVDVGQGGDTEELRQRALDSGAMAAENIDARAEFASNFATRVLAANALYQRKYPLVSALSRPLICEHLAAACKRHGARYVAHGCTGKGNDQIRFEVSLGALLPDVKVLAPARDWGMSREETIEYGLKYDLPISMGPKNPYSIDENMWGRAIECGILEDPFAEPPDEIWTRTRPLGLPPAYVDISFRNGLPRALDGLEMDFALLTETIDKIAGSYGYGRVDMIEDRVVGIKTREVYEAPGALALIAAHTDLEELTLDRAVLRMKRTLQDQYAELVYEGLWHSPLRAALDAFVDNTQRYVNGTVRMKFEAGSAKVVGRSSPASLYDTALATYDRADSFDHKAAEGFVKLWGLPLRTWARARELQAGKDTET